MKGQKMSNDGLVHLVRLFGAIAEGPSNSGNRHDGKICTAQPGECRHNSKYYTSGMGDAKSWSTPVADNSCPDRCWALQDSPRDMGDEPERKKRATELLDVFKKKT